MSDAPTSAGDRLDLGAAIAAGWDKREVAWEARQERAAALACQGQFEAAMPLCREALALARETFEANDPRLGTSLANLATLLKLQGDGAAARPLFEEARRCWDGSWVWIAGLRIERKGRSSLYHLRLEARHWEQYEANARERLKRFADEARLAVGVLADGGPPPARGFERWRGEKPPSFTDSRKLLAACLLLVCAPA